MINAVHLISTLGMLTLVASTNSSFKQSVWNSTCNSSVVNNTGCNNSTNIPQDEPLKAFDYIQVLVCIAIMITGFIGNLMVIVIFSMRWSVLKTCEVFMISLAVADILGTFTIPLDRIRDILQLHNKDAGDFIGCQISTWLSSMCVTVSSLTLVAIAIDRFVIVAWPLKFRNGPNLVIYVTIFMTWLIGACYAAPYLLHVQQSYHPSIGHFCIVTLDSEEYRKYIVAVFILQLVIPLWGMTFLYSFIVFKLRPVSVSARRLSETDNVVRIRTMRQRKATKLFIVVVVVFTILVLPFNIISLLVQYNQIPPTRGNRRIYDCLVLMLAANSCVNPMIYSRLHKSFRKSTLSLLFGCCIPEYYKYEWDSKFISRSSFRRRRRGTDQSTTRNTTASFRKSAPPVPDDLATQSASTTPRTLSAVSSRSSRLSSAGSDDVFLRKPSLKAPSRNEENYKLQKIPEVNSSVSVPDASISNSGNATPEPKPGKYIQFVNCPLQDSDNEADVKTTTVDSSDIQLHCVPRSVHARESSSEDSCDGKMTNRFTSNGYASLNGTPCKNGNSYLNDTEL